MTESQPGATGPFHLPSDAENAEDADDLELFAIEDHFADAFRSGSGPRLAEYLRRYPEYAGQLTEFVSQFLPVETGDSDDAQAADQDLSASVAPGLSPGTRRALDTILAGLGAAAGADAAEPLLVAEEQAAYTTQPAQRDAPVYIAGVPLPELAVRAGLSPEELAEAVRAAAAGAPETLSPALARRIAAALGMSDDDARRALAAGR